MEFFNVIRTRKSVRAFTSQTIEQDIMTPLLKAIQSSPTAGNLQAYQVYVVENQELIKALGEAAYNQKWVWKAPAVLVFCSDPPRSEETYGDIGRNLYCIMDTTIAATIAHLTAVSLGLGSVLVGAFKESEVAMIINAPPHQHPLLMLPIGHPDEEPVQTSRRSLDDLVVRL